ncbi:ABC transporter transmembrane domain-containing protein [Paenibacillus sp. GXUN7292]|uniref:ABC transporter transmembrane domain-containing protein n=1 Tax=Paenibacillus sp. GXUN7292 TaxID=3422499 RepID=UPI003D7D4C10
MKSGKLISSSVKKHKWLSILFVISVFIEIGYASFSTLSLKYIVDDAFTDKDWQVFIFILSLLLIGGLLSIAAGAFGDYSIGKVSGIAIRNLRERLFQHIQKQTAPFFSRFRVGDLVSRFSSDMDAIDRVISTTSPFLIKEALALVLGLGLLLSLEWRLTLVMLLGSSLMFIGPKLLQGKAEQASESYKQSEEQFSNTIDEMIKGHSTIKNLNLGASFQQQAEGQISGIYRSGLRLHLIHTWMTRLPLISLLLLNGIMIGFGGYLIFQDALTIGSFMAFFTLFMSVGQSATNLSVLLPEMIDSAVSFKRVNELLEQDTKLPQSAHPIKLEPVLPQVHLQQVSFGYESNAALLKQIELTIAPGSYIAFVGPSGSGKSTALKLLARFYDPIQGSITFNGVDLREAEDASLREMMTMVTQDTFLFNTTIAENLQIAAADNSQEALVDAASQAQIHSTIANWPMGYNTVIQHDGASLSGGERQRLAIARALLRKPKLLLLDEVTAALDPINESEINQMIASLKGKHTIVSVTHRLASTRDADYIYVFQDGHIAEQGSFADLIDGQGLFHSLWEKQHGFKLSEDGQLAAVEAERLAMLPFFAGIELPALQQLSSLFTTVTCQPDEVVIREGEQGNTFYLIAHGRFEILKQQADLSNKRVAMLQDGDYFGEIALIRNIPRTATVKSIGHGILLAIRRESFGRLVEQHPQLLDSLEHTLLQRMKEATTQ